MPKQTNDWSVPTTLSTMSISTKRTQRSFRSSSVKKEKGAESGSVASMSAGEVLKGRIVEITKDFVVIDVGLKSEGIVPIDEFVDPSSFSSAGEVEVFLEQAEDEDGQIVLSREKATPYAPMGIYRRPLQRRLDRPRSSHPQSQRRPDGRYRHRGVPARFANRQQAHQEPRRIH